ncbi:DegT/DnrJ/EryC1/StrS family aminotransferase [Paenibacillus timonensis]|uniref:DegT/DnrJ/EryC1/StrS family aminotransferase n=1 Tax=Paenibacillus timonensis TaxID=225915 RepID=A0ABW3SBP4_9BACL|nr:DegT/DnrJ/EryC1/StrS family aminotransferase [Paenibacillus timonensis]MCH1640245.1 DegT/DnrJ/EryC1/StrS family aminotransferase [Paenibacillus timonensis]
MEPLRIGGQQSNGIAGSPGESGTATAAGKQSAIPLLDLKREIAELKPQILQAIEGVLDEAAFIMGSQVKRLEQEVAEYLGTKHAIALNSGTDALVIALLAAGIGPGDEVVTTPFTFFATAEAISRVGAEPVYADVNPLTYNLDLDGLEAVITPRTKAIIPVHLFGRPLDMDRLMEQARRHGLIVIEDTAQAFGAEAGGRKAGTIGEMGCYSFFPSKNLGAYGDGGLLVTDDPELAEAAAMLRTHGSKRKYINERVGFNSRLDEIQAAILRVKLPYIEAWNEGRRQAAARYHELLRDIPGLMLPGEVPTGDKQVFHQYTLRVLNGRRDALQAGLSEVGISSIVYYPLPVHRLPVYADRGLTFPLADRLSQEVLSLPIWPQIGADVQEHIAGHIRRLMG